MARNVFAEIAARIGYLVTRFFVPPFVLAHVGMEAYGLYGTIFILVAYAGISTMGVSNAYIRFVAKYAAEGRYDRANQLLSSGLFVTAPLSALLFAMFWSSWPWVAAWMRVPPALAGDARTLALTIVGAFLGYLSLSVFRDALTGAQKIAAVQYIWVATFVIETILIFGLLSRGYGLASMGAAFAVRMLLEVGLSAAVAFRVLPWLRLSPALVRRDAIRDLIGFGGVVQANGLLAIALGSIERIVAAPLAGLSAAGVLDLGKKLPGMASSIPSAFLSSLLPRAAEAHARGEDMRPLYLQWLGYVNVSAALFCGFLACAASPLLRIWLGVAPPGAPLLMTLFAVATHIHLITGPGTSVLKGSGHPRGEFFYSLSNFAALALTLPAARALAGEWSAVAIGAAVSAGTVLSAAFFLWRAGRLLGVPVTQSLGNLVAGAVPYALAAPFAAALHVADPQGRWTLAAWTASAGCGYLTACAAWLWRQVLSPDERRWIMWRVPALRPATPALQPGRG